MNNFEEKAFMFIFNIKVILSVNDNLMREFVVKLYFNLYYLEFISI